MAVAAAVVGSLLITSQALAWQCIPAGPAGSLARTLHGQANSVSGVHFTNVGGDTKLTLDPFMPNPAAGPTMIWLEMVSGNGLGRARVGWVRYAGAWGAAVWHPYYYATDSAGTIKVNETDFNVDWAYPLSDGRDLEIYMRPGGFGYSGSVDLFADEFSNPQYKRNGSFSGGHDWTGDAKTIHTYYRTWDKQSQFIGGHLSENRGGVDSLFYVTNAGSKQWAPSSVSSTDTAIIRYAINGYGLDAWDARC